MTRADRTGPLVSVIIPAFDAEATLGDAAGSVLAGTYLNVEIIIVDDGSSDTTFELAEKLAQKDPRVQVYSQPNRGLSAALNAGLERATGDYVARLDADDLWHPSKLARQVALAVGDPDLAFIYCWVRYVDARGAILSDGPQQRFPRNALRRSVVESLVGGGSSALIRRDATIEAGGCDEGLRSYEDWLLQLAISASHPVGFVPEYLVGYRVRPGSLTDDPDKMLEQWRKVGRRAKRAFPQVPRQVHAWANARRCTGFAEAFAWRGRMRACAAQLIEAARSDPAWTSHFLRFRVGRRLRRRPDPTLGRSPAFVDCNPTEAVMPASDDRDARLARLIDRRNAYLAALDFAGDGG